MTGFEAASLAAAIVAAVGVWHGVRAMVRADKERAVVPDQRPQASERQTASLEAVVERTARLGPWARGFEEPEPGPAE